MRAQHTPFRSAFVRLCLIAALGLSTACRTTIDSTAPTEDSHFGRVMIRFRDFRGKGTKLALVNETAINRVDYYSNIQSSPGLKVASDEIMNALVEVFENEGFWDTARPGAAPGDGMTPTEGGVALHAVLFMETAEHKGWITFRKGLDRDELERFQDCSQAFIAIYNRTAGFQNVNNPKGKALFQEK